MFSVMVGLLLLVVGYVIVINSVSSGMMKVDNWVYHRYWLKNYFAGQIQKPKILIMGGSASGMGIDSTKIAEETGMPTVNLAIHAGMPYQYYTELVERFVKPGDVVVLPLEFKRYSLGLDFSLDLVLQLYFSVDPALQKGLSLSDLFHLYAGYGCRWLFEVVKMLSAKRKRYYKEDAVAEWQKAQSLPMNKAFGYHAKYVNECGDWITPKDLRWPIRVYHFVYPIVSKDFVEFYQEMTEKIHRHGGRFCLTYTNIVFFPMIAERFTRLRAELHAKGIEIQGNPGDFYVPEEYYFDTYYHLNEKGVDFFSRALAKTVKEFIRDDCCDPSTLEFSFDHPPSIVAFPSGFSTPDSNGMWSVGEKSVMRIRDPGFPFEHNALVFGVKSSVPDNDVEISINGQRSGYWHFSQGDSQKRLDVHCVQTNELEITFSVTKTMCSKERGSSFDSRPLALLFQSAEVHSVSCPPSEKVIEAPGAIIVSREWHPISGIQDFNGISGVCRARRSHFNIFFPKSVSLSRRILSLRVQPISRKTTPFNVHYGNNTSMVTSAVPVIVRFDLSPEDSVRGQAEVSVEEIAEQDANGYYLYEVKVLGCDSLLDSEFDFRKNDNFVVLHGGFSTCGPQGTWTVGRRSEFTLQLPSGVRNGDILEFVVVPATEGQKADVYSDNQFLAHWDLSKGKENHLKVEFPEGFKQATPDLPLRIIVNKTFCPKEMGLSSDKRHLGIRFLTAKLVYLKDNNNHNRISARNGHCQTETKSRFARRNAGEKRLFFDEAPKSCGNGVEALHSEDPFLRD